VLRVISIGSWTSPQPGERLIESGKPVDSILLIVRGKVRMSKEDGGVLGDMGAGEIVGSTLLLSGAKAEVNAVSIEPLRALRWQASTLQRYLDAHPDTRNVFQRHLARDLAGKMLRIANAVSGAPPSLPAQ
jgi:CRP-like cAMP-binding protein